MKFHPSVLLFALASSSTSAHWLRTADDSSQHQQNQLDSSCLDHSNSKDACYAAKDENGESCAWCVAGAVPNECVSQEQAKML